MNDEIARMAENGGVIGGLDAASGSALRRHKIVAYTKDS